MTTTFQHKDFKLILWALGNTAEILRMLNLDEHSRTDKNENLELEIGVLALKIREFLKDEE